MNIFKKNQDVVDLIRNSEYNTKIYIYFSTKTAGSDYDGEELNYTYTNLNPITIRAIVTDISPEALVWKQYGLQEIGAKEVICEDKYSEWFKKCNKIVIDGDEYSVYKESLGNRVIIQKRPFRLIRIILQRK
jgi:hypothetical protein